MNTDPVPQSSDDRIFLHDGVWFLRARGNDAIGPFASRPAAEAELRQRMKRWMRPEPHWSHAGVVRGIRNLLTHGDPSQERHAS